MNYIYIQAVEIMSDYIGPAADRFLRRQIDFHLKKQPEQITVEDIPILSEWAKAGLSLLTDDKESVIECGNRLSKIT